MSEGESCASLQKRIEKLEERLKFSEKHEAMSLKERNEAWKERERWQGKWLMVKTENNALRKANRALRAEVAGLKIQLQMRPHPLLDKVEEYNWAYEPEGQ